ncbi:MAG: DUF2339 domain-containing protein [Cocleimonas sp.]|nr:DUF2339 domain-containing protein [Cocleimonas sp.]
MMIKSSLYAIIFFLVSVTVLFSSYRTPEWLIIIIATILGFVLGRVSELQNNLNDLRTIMMKDWEQREKIISTKDSEAERVEVKADPFNRIAKTEVPPEKMTTKQDNNKASSQHVTSAIEPNALAKGISLLKGYFTGGNLFVRVGILILFFGVSFLLKYVADRGVFPIEYRLMIVAISAVGLLLFGWSLRRKNKTYGLLLQGAGVGFLYLDIYAAFSLYQLIPLLPAFALMFIISMFSTVLAVLQDSRSLAVFGFTGGFLAPILASNGSNHYIGLFSYYLILNLAIVSIAWFKTWRALNLLGFLFTFVVAVAWGYSSYQTEHFAHVELFLIIFFLLYVVIAILFTLRQPEKRRGYVDGSLFFGVPLAASGLQYALVKNIEYGISISSFIIGAFYLVLAWALWKKANHTLRLLSEALLALGVIFTSLAIPFSLASTHTAATWALEGLGLIWLGSRQNRLSVRVFGWLLQAGAGVFIVFGFVEHIIDLNKVIPFINTPFLSVMIMAVAGILSSRLLSIDVKGHRQWEKIISYALLIWGLLWLFSGVMMQVDKYIGYQWLITSFMLLATLVSLIFMLTALHTKPQWQQAWYVSIALLPAMLFSALIQSDGLGLNIHNDYPFRYGGSVAWPLAFGVLYVLIFQLDKQSLYTRFRSIIHALTAILLVIIITWQGAHQLLLFVAEESSWASLWFAIPATFVLWAIIKSSYWPITGNRNSYLQYTGTILAIYLILWGLSAVISRSSSTLLPWLPLLNPLDITLMIVLLMLYKWWKSLNDKESMVNVSQFQPNKSIFAISIAGLTFLWLNFTLFRIATHWFDVTYTVSTLYDSNLVQTAVSVLWALSGVILTIYANRQQMRTVWIAGGILLGIVVVKLFTVDLSALSSLARIISFLVVGGLLTSIGYFAPLPTFHSPEIHPSES